MYDSVAYHIIQYFNYEKDKLYLLVDETYTEIAQSIKRHHTNTEILLFSSYTSDNIKEIFDLPLSEVVLLLAEPESYVNYKLFQYLDFSKGEPQIENTASKVLIFPKDRICRIFSDGADKNIIEKEKILADMKVNQKYRITTAQGTNLIFESRNWIPLDFEVCTAPQETSINGVIVVDGALFFKKIEDTISFVIENGKIKSITACTSKGKTLVAEYIKMTERDMKHPVNMQLAEIGIGFCNGAIISDCFMESEAVLNTCHFCFGNNVCYGGKNESEFHGASILIKNPVFTRMNE